MRSNKISDLLAPIPEVFDFDNFSPKLEALILSEVCSVPGRVAVGLNARDCSLVTLQCRSSSLRKLRESDEFGMGSDSLVRSSCKASKDALTGASPRGEQGV